LIQYGWETITEALKHGGITNMMDRLSNPSKVEAYRLAEELKILCARCFKSTWTISFRRVFEKHDDRLVNDVNLLTWRAATAETNFENSCY
jgi:ketol-acid reductoisomerase